MISYPCVVCCKATSMWCSRCQSTWYCCPEHLNSDWQRHRRECVPTTAGMQYPTSAPPPLEQRSADVSAVLFLPDEERARIVPVGCQGGSPATADGVCPAPLIEPFFTAGEPKSVILTQGLNNEALRFPLQLWYCPTSLQNRTPVNRAIERVCSGQAPRTWCGPVVVMKYNGSRRQGYTDAGPNDLPALSAYFLAYK